MKLSKLIFGLIIILIIISCNKAYIPEDIMTDPASSDTITYDSNINNIISSNCIGCHSGSNPQGNLLLENYTQVRNATENGTLINRINNPANPMPSNGLMSQSLRLHFDLWVNNDYLEN